MGLHHYSRTLRIWESNFGRDTGWVIECEGKPVAVLTEPRSEDLFWDSYRMEVITDDPELRGHLLAEEFWAGD